MQNLLCSFQDLLIYSKYKRLELESNNKIQELEEKLEAQTIAVLSSPDLNVLGEDITPTLMNYMAHIDGHTYYLEGFLNTFLPDKLSNNDGVICYGEDIPERVNVVFAGLIYDDFYFDIYEGESHFTMSLQDYNNGFVIKEYPSGTLSIACNGKYSHLLFTLGHVDNSGTSRRKVKIYYLNSDGKYIEIFSMEMNKDVPTDTYEVPIYNTKIVKITIE